jgi:FdhD protein
MDPLPEELGWPAYRQGEVERWRGETYESREDWIAEEAPIALLYNGEPHAVMLATPLDLEDFALGFSLTESILAAPAELHAIRIYRRAEGIEVRMSIDPVRCATLPEQARNLAGRTGCGLCGARTLAQAMRKPPPVRSAVTVPAADLLRALSELSGRQNLNRLTGAIHAAAWAVPGQGVQVVREDVGRHNALDKLIGALACRGTDFGAGFVVVTSRASYEMVQKCAMAGIGFMAAISAPTGLAVRRAEEAGLTLVGFARGDGHVVYSHPHRLLHPSEQP